VKNNDYEVFVGELLTSVLIWDTVANLEMRNLLGYWEITVKKDGDLSEGWRALRSPDGTYRELLENESGGGLRIEIGFVISDTKAAFAEMYYLSFCTKICNACHARVVYRGQDQCSVEVGHTEEGRSLPIIEEQDLSIFDQWKLNICPCCEGALEHLEVKVPNG